MRKTKLGRANCSQNCEKGFMGEGMVGGKGGHNSEQSVGTERSPVSAKVLSRNTASVVCSLDFLWRSVHYCIQAKGQAQRDRHVVRQFS